MSTEQRRLLADKLLDVANVAAGALLFGQFLGEAAYSIPFAMIGVAVWLVLVAFSIALTKENSP